MRQILFYGEDSSLGVERLQLLRSMIQAQNSGMFYLYFLSPFSLDENRISVSALLLAFLFHYKQIAWLSSSNYGCLGALKSCPYHFWKSHALSLLAKAVLVLKAVSAFQMP